MTTNKQNTFLLGGFTLGTVQDKAVRAIIYLFYVILTISNNSEQWKNKTVQKQYSGLLFFPCFLFINSFLSPEAKYWI